MSTPAKPSAVDGSTLRLYRMVILGQYIKEVGSATLERLQAFMTIKFGLKRRTTTEMVKDMQNAHLLHAQSKTFTLTPNGHKWLTEMAKKDTL